MQSAIAMQDSYQGVTQEERTLLRQIFDNLVKETLGVPGLPRDLSSIQGENDDIIN